MVPDGTLGEAFSHCNNEGRTSMNESLAYNLTGAAERRPHTAALRFGEDVITYAELDEATALVAAVLRDRGIEPGDRVGIMLPNVPQFAMAYYGVMRAGGVVIPMNVLLKEREVAFYLGDSGAKLIFAWHELADGARAGAADVGAGCLVVEPDSFAELLEAVEPVHEVVERRADDTAVILYTSGTTGKPKGAVHTHAGFLVKVASEVAYEFDVRRGDVFFWLTDMGWVMGPLSTFGTHALGATLLLYEGAPDTPGPGRVWALAARHNVTMLGVSPTLIRALKSYGDDVPAASDLSSVRVFGSTGEPWDEDSYRWLSRVVGGGRVPIINFSGGTEVGGSFLSPYVVEPIKACSLGGPSLGMDVEVFDRDGKPVREQLGELVCRQPWPAMTRGVWGDFQRYHDSYWSMFPGVWRHGDWAKVDIDGQWFLYGRSDEAINVAGKRVGPAEIEGILVAHPAVAEAAAVGVPDPVKGEAIWCFWTPVGDSEPDVSEDLATAVGHQLGKPFTPAHVFQVDALPKTRSAKILRRAIRAAAVGEDPGDLSGAENPGALELIRAAVQTNGRSKT
jgi:acetyl-CoA synthetase